MGPSKKTHPMTDGERRNRLACVVAWCCAAATGATDARNSWESGDFGDAVDALDTALRHARWTTSALEEALADMEELEEAAGR